MMVKSLLESQPAQFFGSMANHEMERQKMHCFLLQLTRKDPVFVQDSQTIPTCALCAGVLPQEQDS